MNEANASLAAVLEAQLDCAEQLMAVLDQEQAALTGRSVEALETVCLEKTQAAQALQRLSERLQLLAGPQRSNAEFEAWLSRHADAETLIGTWQRLRILSRDLADANRRNGTLLEVREQQVRGALLAMAPEPPAIYGRNGLRPGAISGRVFSRA